MTQAEQTLKNPDLFENAKNLFIFLRLISLDVIKEILIGIYTKAMPASVCLIVGVGLSSFFMFYLDGWFFSLIKKTQLLISIGRIRDWATFFMLFSGFYAWGLFRVFKRLITKKTLDRAFINAGLETKLKERPKYYSDFPIDEYSRKLTLRTGGLPLSSFMTAKEHVESNLNISIVKMENPQDNKQFVELVYSTQKMPDLWILENLNQYKDFSFPIGLSHQGEIKTSFKHVPHFLIAGESGSGKSTFIRMMLTILLSNNEDIEIYYFDFKSGMENQIFSGFRNMHCIDEIPDAANKMAEVLKILSERMVAFSQAKATSLEMYNKSPHRKGRKEKRIVIVVDEVAELMQSFKTGANSDMAKINSGINKIARMGRAVGINLAIGVQKPDAKNLDPTIKANLSGVICFAVSHFSQSVVVLGNSRAADLNKHYKGRAIWKHGLEFIEVQAPLLSEEEVQIAREEINKYWQGAAIPQKEKHHKTLNSQVVN